MQRCYFNDSFYRKGGFPLFYMSWVKGNIVIPLFMQIVGYFRRKFKQDGRWKGQYSVGHDPITGAGIQECTWQTPSRGQGETRKSFGRSWTDRFHKIWTVYGWNLDGRLVRECGKDQSQANLPSDLSGLHRQPHQAKHRQHPAGETDHHGLAEILPQTVDLRQSGTDRIRKAARSFHRINPANQGGTTP